ncbi:MAG TPA: sigma-70 family RNA polymerase sigma factor [Candidatus Cybelea sp.]
MRLKIEPEVVESAQAGSEALEPLIAAVWPEAYRVALVILRDRGLAEDAAQEACAAIARSLTSLKSSDAFAAWSYKIVVSHALASARRRRRTESLDALADRGVGFDRSGTLDLYAALASLTPLQRAAILLRYYAGLSSSEISAATGVPSPTVRFHLMRARRALRTALSAGPNPFSYDEALTDVH